MPALDFLHPDSAASVRGYGCFDVPLLATGMFRTGPPLSVPGLLDLGPAASLHSRARSAFAPFVLDFLHLDPVLPPHSSACGGLAPPALGLSRTGLFLSACDCVALGVLLSLKSLACSEVALLASDSARADSSLPLQSFSRLGAVPFVTGMLRVGLPLSALDAVNLESSPPTQSSGRPDLLLPALDALHSGPPLLSRSSGRTASRLVL